MDSNNPYAPPESAPSAPERLELQDLDTPSLRKLRNHSHTIRTLGALGFLGLLGLSVMLASSGINRDMEIRPLLVAAAGLNAVTAYALWRRPKWGRVPGMLFCVVSLVWIPVGTAIGILGAISLINGGILFGPDRLDHKQLDREWRYRKKNRIP